MAIQQEKSGSMLENAIGAIGESLAPFWKPMIVAAPLIGTALFFASGTNAQTSGNAVPSPTAAASGPVAPIAAPEAARAGRPKIRSKMATGRVASPPTTTEPTADAPVAPIAAPEAARTGRPKIRDKTPTNDSVASPPATTEPVVQPTERRRKGPKERDDPVSTRTGAPTSDPATTTPNPSGERAIRKNVVPKATSGRSNLLLPALGGAAAIAAIVAATSGNDRPASP